jgi:hypothetical protein
VLCRWQTYLVQTNSDIADPPLDQSSQRQHIIFQVDLDAKAGAAFCR